MLLHAIMAASRANGPGLRAVVWFQGCALNCRNCFNVATHPFEGHHIPCDLNHKMAASATLCFPGDATRRRPQGSEGHCELHCATARAGGQSDSGTLRREDLCAIGGEKGISRQECGDLLPSGACYDRSRLIIFPNATVGALLVRSGLSTEIRPSL